MLPRHAYRQQQAAQATRIDVLLSCYDGAIERLDRALEALRRGEDARLLLLKFQAFVLALASGVHTREGDPVSQNLLRLYEYCGHCAAEGEAQLLESARGCLCTLREAFLAIRADAVRLEQSGAIPAVDAPRYVQTVG